MPCDAFGNKRDTNEITSLREAMFKTKSVSIGVPCAVDTVQSEPMPCGCVSFTSTPKHATHLALLLPGSSSRTA